MNEEYYLVALDYIGCKLSSEFQYEYDEAVKRAKEMAMENKADKVLITKSVAEVKIRFEVNKDEQ